MVIACHLSKIYLQSETWLCLNQSKLSHFYFKKQKKSAIDSPPGCFYRSFEYRRKHFANYCVIFDIACRRTYRKEALKDVLNLKPVRCELISHEEICGRRGCVKTNRHRTNLCEILLTSL